MPIRKQQQLLLPICLLFGALCCMRVGADFFAACNGIAKGKFIASNKSCTHFIACNDADSYEDECPDGTYFSVLPAICELMGSIDCRLNNSSAPSAPIAPPVPVVALPTAPTLANIPTNTMTTAMGLPLLPSNNGQLPAAAGSGSGSGSGGDASAVAITVASACPAVDNPQLIVFVPDTRSCRDYYICYHGEPLAMHCAEILHFNAQTGRCDHAENVKCAAQPLSVRQRCKWYTIDMYPHAENCNYYYSCRNGYLMLQQCPINYGWDFGKRSCVQLQQAKCYNTIFMKNAQ